MNVSIGERWEGFVDNAVKSGRYASASEVVREGLRLVEEREAKLHALQDLLNASVAEGGDHSDEDLGAALDAEEAAMGRRFVQGQSKLTDHPDRANRPPSVAVR